MRRRAAIAGLAIVLTLAAYLAERQHRNGERVRLDEARAALERESERARTLDDQMSALRDQMTALGDRMNGLERDNRDLRRRLASSRRPHTEVAALAPSVEPVAPAVEAAALSPSVEAHLVGEPPPLEGLRLMPGGEWPVAERVRIPASNRFAAPAFMKRMYVGYGILQAADIGTTIAALQRGGRETNPFLQGIAARPAALIVVKAATTAGTVLIAKKLRRTRPVAAAITLAAINSTLAVVAVNNARTIKEQRQP